MRRLVAVYVAYAILFTAFLVADFAQADGYEEGAFPDRIFYIVRSPPGSLRSDVYVSYVWPAVAGEWSLRLVRLSGPFVTVKLFEESPGVPFLIDEWRLGRTGQELGPVLMQAGVRYRLEFTPQGRPGTSILAERFESNNSPVACFTYYPLNPAVNLGVFFDASCSFDPDGDPLQYYWDFGEGQTSQEQYVSIGYRSPGTFAVTLWVLDGKGGAANTTQVVTVAGETSQFIPPHYDFPLDEDGDGLLDVLVLRVNVSVGVRDPYVDYYGRYYRLSAYFQAGNQSLWDDHFASYAPGPVTIELRFRGVGIRVGGAPGPYLIQLTFVHSPTNTLLDEDVHQTRAYDPAAFQAPPATFEPPHSDTGIDADGDGKFEVLAIDVGVQVGQAGTYSVRGWLYTREPVQYLGVSEVHVDLETGWTTVRLTYSGVGINTSDVDGPYRAEVYLSDGMFILDNVTVWTAAYDRRAFEGPEVSFFGVHDDYGVDVDGDGLFEFLELSLSVVATTNVSFLIEATLTGILNETSDYYIDRVITYGALTPGLARVPLQFRSEPINLSQFDGPYHVYLTISLTISPYTGRDSDLYTTHLYDHAEFKGPVARVTGRLTDYGVDTDQDGRFNYMVVEVPVQVHYRAELILAGLTIYPCCPNVRAANVSTYEPGTYRLRLWFDGVELRLLGYVGAFTVRLHLIDNATHQDLHLEDYVTSAYSYTGFEEPPAGFAPPHAEYGLDTDGDGRYNSLVVEAVVDVQEPDTYVLAVGLGRSYYNIAYGSNVSFLAPGIHRLRVLFDTVPLNASRVNTTYLVTLSLWSHNHSVVFAYDSFVTRFYNYTAFEEIPFLLAPPHRDYALDTDGDGLFNEIVVEVVLSALEPGTVWLNAVLYLSSEILFAFNSTTVDSGNPVVTVHFDTYRLRGASGPYWVDLTLYSGTYGQLDRGTHITSSYQSDQFDPPMFIDVSRTTDFGQDVDGNGLYDYLVIGVVVELAAPGYYRLEAFIALDGQGYVSGDAVFLLGAGRHVANVSLRGVSLWAAGQDGPYEVTVTVHQFYSGTAVRATYTTSAYSWSDFEPTGASFSGAALGETPFDADGDGLYDVLFVNVTIEVRIAGNYSIGACLNVVANYCRIGDIGTQILSEGSHIVSLELLGGAIRGLGIDGPYNVTVVLSPVPPGTTSPEWTVRRTFQTAAYRHTDFEVIVAFESITDRGVDTNGNGRFEYLEISIVVLVEVPSRYFFEAALEVAPWYVAYVHLEGDLAVGRPVLTFRFEAYLFNATGRDGPYPLRIYLNAHTLGIVVEGTHETMAYRVADFE